VAEHLATQGQQVAFVGLLDAFYQPGIKPARWPALRRLAFHTSKTLALGPGYVARKLRKRQQLAEEIRADAGRVKPETTEEEKTHLRRIAFMREIITPFRGRPYSGAVTVFRAVADPHPFDHDFGYNGWKAIVLGEVGLEDFECSHLDLSEEPYVGDLASRIESRLGNLEA
jgi:thioesterase domain-containing protein